MDRKIRWRYTTTILRLRIGARLTRYRNCKFHNFARTISRHADGICRYSVPPSAGPLLPLCIRLLVCFEFLREIGRDCGHGRDVSCYCPCSRFVVINSVHIGSSLSGAHLPAYIPLSNHGQTWAMRPDRFLEFKDALEVKR